MSTRLARPIVFLMAGPLVLFATVACGAPEPAATPGPAAAPQREPTAAPADRGEAAPTEAAQQQPKPTAKAAPQKTYDIRIVQPANSFNLLMTEAGAREGFFKKHGINLTVDIREFNAFLNALPTKETLVGPDRGMGLAPLMNQGRQLELITGGLALFHQVFVRADSDYHTLDDLAGKKFGVFSTGSATYKAFQAAAVDAFDFNIQKETVVVEAAPPALLALLNKGEVDAMLNVSGLTVAAGAQPDKYRPIFAAGEYWKKKTGFQLCVACTAAWTEWIQEDPERAAAFAAAVTDTMLWARQNPDEAIDKYAELLGLDTEGKKQYAKQLLRDENMFLLEWNQKAIDALWDFLELEAKTGVIEEVPPQDKHARVLEGVNSEPYGG